ncbi:hypothetical protein MKX03_003996, partial [Papaver bracteatum]
MAQLSLIFKDSLSVVGDDDLTCTYEKVSSISDAPTLSHESLRGSASAISPDFLFTLGSL